MRLSVILILTHFFLILPGYGSAHYLIDNGLISAISEADSPENDPLANDPPENNPPKVGHSAMVWHWEDAFNSAEREKIEVWIQKVNKAAEKTLGVYPFAVHCHIYERAGSAEPVPWAHTWRYPEQSLHFYIDTKFTLDNFLDDWTAPHEISHLSIPYLGEDNAWFAEGYASFMQYQVMMELGIYSEEEVNQKYREKIKKITSYYQSNKDLVTVARNLREGRKHSPMYWGGASYFMTLNRILEEKHETSLTSVVRTYQECCRLKDRSLKDVVKSWDEIIGIPLASLLLKDYQNEPAREMVGLYLK